MTALKQISVFLIYAHTDKKVVNKLYRSLIKDGIHAWLDTEDLQPGQNWQHEIHKAVLKSDVILVCLSHKFNEQHGYRHEELQLALEKKKLLDEEDVFIIPVRMEKCDMPESLRYLHRVDVFESGGYKKLIRALQRIENQTDNHMSS